MRGGQEGVATHRVEPPPRRVQHSRRVPDWRPIRFVTIGNLSMARSQSDCLRSCHMPAFLEAMSHT